MNAKSGAKNSTYDPSKEQVHTSPVSDGETRTRDREGLRTSAGVATSARDMSVAEGIYDHPS